MGNVDGDKACLFKRKIFADVFIVSECLLNVGCALQKCLFSFRYSFAYSKSGA